MTRDDLVRFHRTWFKPNHATLVIVGDVSLAEIQPKPHGVCSAAGVRATSRRRTSAPWPICRATRLHSRSPRGGAVDHFRGDLAPPKANPHEYAIEAMTSLLGGQFTSRVNMNLRGRNTGRTGVHTWSGTRAAAPVHRVRTGADRHRPKESMIRSIGAARLLARNRLTADELAKAQANLTRRLAGNWETMDAVQGSLEQLVTFG